MDIQIKNLNYAYDNRKVLEDINFKVEEGEILSIMGPNGVGKSTLLKILAGYYRSDKGSVFLGGKDILKYGRRELAKLISYVPQDTSINYDFTVEEVVLAGRYPYRISFLSGGKEDEENLEKALNLTGIRHLRDRKITKLSGGERQRVLIAKSLAQDTDIILLDEPTSQLDINHEIEILKLIEKINRKENKTIIMVLHDINLSSRFSKRIIFLKENKIYKIGSPEEVIDKKIIENVYDTKVEIDKNNYTGFLQVTVL